MWAEDPQGIQVRYYSNENRAEKWTEEEDRLLFDNRHQEDIVIPGRSKKAVQVRLATILKWEAYFDKEYSEESTEAIRKEKTELAETVRELKKALAAKDAEIEERVREAQKEANEVINRSNTWVEKQVEERTSELTVRLLQAQSQIRYQERHNMNEIWDYNIQLRHQVKKLEEEKAELEKKVKWYSAALKLLGVTKDSWQELKSRIKL
jgi:hypothetical protein